MSAKLFDQHLKFLEDRAISADVAEARGYCSAITPAALKAEGFGRTVSQRIPGLLIPIHDVNGTIPFSQYRPDRPQVLNGKTRKYEVALGTRYVVDVPPQVLGQMGDPGIPLWITESAPKADAGVSARLCCIAVLGVWAWKGTNSRGGKTILPCWESIALNGRTVYIAFDSDSARNPKVADAIIRFGRWLVSKGANVWYVPLPDAAGGIKQGLDDWLHANGGDIGALKMLAEDEPPLIRRQISQGPGDRGKDSSGSPQYSVYGSRAPHSTADISGDGFPPVRASYTKWLGENYDTGALDVVLCAARAEKLAGDPPWLMNVAGSGCAKTETVTPLAAAGARLVSMLSGEAALLSATPADRRAAEATGGLLRELGDRGLLVIKDFTSVLSMHRDSRAKVISALREIHDGYWVRDVGADGGLKIPWAGRIMIVAACTTAWDAHREVVASMGDRFLIVRQRIDRHAAGEQAIANTGSEAAMRDEIGGAVRDLLARPVPPELPAVDGTAGLLSLADLVTRCRTPVERDYQGNPAWAHDLEAPTRFAKQLTQLARGGLSLGMTQDAARAVAARAARDSMPPAYLKVLDDVRRNPLSRTADTGRRLHMPWRTADRALQELWLLGTLHRQGDDKDRWVYTLDSAADAAVKLITTERTTP